MCLSSRDVTHSLTLSLSRTLPNYFTLSWHLFFSIFPLFSFSHCHSGSLTFFHSCSLFSLSLYLPFPLYLYLSLVFSLTLYGIFHSIFHYLTISFCFLISFIFLSLLVTKALYKIITLSLSFPFLSLSHPLSPTLSRFLSPAP